MAGALTAYMTAACRALGLKSLVLTDTNGVEIARGGDEIEEAQMLAAVFQSAIESTAKVPIGALRTVVLRHAPYFLVQRSMSSVYLTAVLEREHLLGKTLAAMDKMQAELTQVVQLFANTEAI